MDIFQSQCAVIRHQTRITHISATRAYMYIKHTPHSKISLQLKSADARIIYPSYGSRPLPLTHILHDREITIHIHSHLHLSPHPPSAERAAHAHARSLWRACRLDSGSSSSSSSSASAARFVCCAHLQEKANVHLYRTQRRELSGALGPERTGNGALCVALSMTPCR